ncbi:AMP-binding protein [Salinibacterium sp. ZJ454]|uniref:AMP-binding protein n=1 Tax=Salinibacterium sp. ZJ454 TaxID=2708339 RepID=UPI0014222DE9|nr:AMP-binding protein [Salinibacterium sp. ZJ454]
MSSEIRSAFDVYDAETIDRFKRDGWWHDVHSSELLAHHAANRPDATAVVAGDDRITWSELHDRVTGVATALAGLGLEPGECIGIQLPNSVDLVVSYLAAQCAGLIPLTMMTIYREDDVIYMLGKCRARAYIYPSDSTGFDFATLAAKALDAVDSLEFVLPARSASGERSVQSLAATPADHDALAAGRQGPDSVSRVGFTSGTTSRPKGVLHTHNTDLVTPFAMADEFGLDENSTLWMPSPMAHVTGLLYGIYLPLVTGAKIVAQDKWDPREALQLINKERVAFTVSATPFIVAMLQQTDLLESLDLSSFRYFVSGGARIPTAVVERAKERIGCDLLRVFGMSEGPICTLVRPDDDWAKHASTDGRPFAGAQVKVVDPEDRSRTLPHGEIGEYATRGPNRFLGYLHEPEQTAECTDAEGWFYSGDLVQTDSDDFVVYVDRMKDIVNRGGIKISALEVENLLAAHEAIAAAAIIPVSDDRLGEIACAVVLLHAGETLTLEEIGRFLEERGVTKQKWPERLVIRAELPMTSTGKVQKNMLRAELDPDWQVVA